MMMVVVIKRPYLYFTNFNRFISILLQVKWFPLCCYYIVVVIVITYWFILFIFNSKTPNFINKETAEISVFSTNLYMKWTFNYKIT